MIITTINNNKLFIQFDRIIQKGLIHMYNDEKFSKNRDISNSEFEVIDLPEVIEKIHIEIQIENENIIKRSINIKQ